jgi:hypothetical protein
MFSSVQFSASVADEIFQSLKVAFDDFALLEAGDNCGTYVRAATDSGCIAQSFGCLFDRGNNLSLTSRTFFNNLSPDSGESARADNRACPSAKIFCSKTLTHHFLDVFVDVPSLDIDQLATSVLVFEDFAPWVLK